MSEVLDNNELTCVIREAYPNRVTENSWGELIETTKNKYRIIATAAVEVMLLLPPDKWIEIFLLRAQDRT